MSVWYSRKTRDRKSKHVRECAVEESEGVDHEKFFRWVWVLVWVVGVPLSTEMLPN